MTNPPIRLPALALLLAATGCVDDPADTDRAVAAITNTQLPLDDGPDTGPPQVGTLDGAFAVGDDGAATYSVPILAAAGRAGIEPSVALTYSSHGGDGLAGVGWSVTGLSQITRCGRSFWRDGEVRPMQFGPNDNFCLDGVRLVKVSGAADVTAAACTRSPRQEYRTEPDSFARVVACGADTSGPIEWVVYDKGGPIHRYGGDDVTTRLETTAAAPDANGNSGAAVTRRLGWLRARTEDRAGNYLVYRYGRSAALDRLEWWPIGIDYTGGPAGSPNRSVLFDYDARTDESRYVRGVEMTRTHRLRSITVTAPSPSAQPLPYVRRYDLTYGTGAQSGRSLLASLQVCDGLGTGTGVRHCLPATTFTYARPSPFFTMTTQGTAPWSSGGAFDLFASDLTGDGKDDLFYSHRGSNFSFDYTRIAGGTTIAPAFGAAIQNTFDREQTLRVPHDNNGDDAVDVISQGCTHKTGTGANEECDETGAILYPSDRAGQFGLSLSRTICSDTTPICGSVQAAADLNGDLSTDLVLGTGALLSVRSVNAVPFATADSYVRPPATNGKAVYVDVDGDGHLDLLAPYAYGGATRYDAVHVRGADDAPSVETTALGLDLAPDNCQIFADVNADGLADVVDVRAGAMVRLNRGDGRFRAAVSWAPSGWTGTPVCAQQTMVGYPWLGWKHAGVFPIDWNGDGRQDLLVLQPITSSSESARVLVSTGTGFTSVVLNIPLACASTTSPPEATTLDANGDGLLDVLFTCRVGTNRELRLYTQNAGSPEAAGHGDLLTDVRDGLGALVRHVEYRPLTDPTVYTKTTDFIQPLPVVASESVDDGDGNRIEIARHVYEGGTRTGDSEGWLGFRRHTITDPRTGSRRRLTFAADGAGDRVAAGGYLGGRPFHPFRGQRREELSWVTVDNVVRATRTVDTPAVTAEAFPNGAADYFTYVASSTSESFEAAAATFDPDAPGGSFQRTVTTATVDACGDPTRVSVDRAPGAAVPVLTTTTRTYAAPALAYCDLGPTWLDFLSFESVRSFEGGTTQVHETQWVAEADGTGRVRDVIRQPGGTADQRRCARVYHRDPFGNADVVDVTAGGCNRVASGPSATRTTSTVYDADGVYPVTITNAAGHVRNQQVHPGLGVLVVETDANARTVTHQYDGFGRPVRTDLPDGSGNFPSTIFTTTAYLPPGSALPASRCNGGGYSASAFAMAISSATTGGEQTIECRDRLGRARRRASNATYDGTTGTTGWSYVDTVFDSDGSAPHDAFPERVYQVTRPHALTASAAIAGRATYDAAGRLKTQCHQRFGGAAGDASACTTSTYSPLQTDTCDEHGVHTRSVAYAYGPVARTATFPDATSCTNGNEVATRFGYGPFDTLVSVTDAQNNVVTQAFDEVGRRTGITDGDVGTTTATFTGFDEVATETNARGQVTTSTYDGLGRLLSRVAPDGTDTFTWDPANGKGQAGTATRGTTLRTTTYDALGRPLVASLRVDGTTYDTTTAYDAQGRVSTVTTAAIAGLGRLIVHDVRDAAGDVVRVELGRASATCTGPAQCQSGESCSAALGNVCARDLWRADTIDAEGRVTKETSGDGVTTTTGYDGAFLASILGQQGTTTVQNDGYAYFDNGSLSSRIDRTFGVTETFGYDGADRLTSSQAGTRPVQRYGYDNLGNLTSDSGLSLAGGCTGGTSLEYTKSTPWGAVGPHALTRAVCGPYAWPVQHDASGNHTNGLNNADAFTWTSFDKLATTRSAYDTWQLGYDAEHTRVKKDQIAGSSPYYPWTSIVYAGPIERRLAPGREQVLFQAPIGSATFELSWDWNTTTSTGTQALRYLHADRLGSPEVITGDGAVVERRSYDAWGFVRGADMVSGGPWPMVSLTSFTGHHEDLGMLTGDGYGFQDMGGRVYSPLLRRFWSPDPVVQAPLYGPSWNRFAYTFDNPLKFTDPTGYDTASFFAPIVTMGDGAGETWTGSGIIAAGQSASGELTTTWDGKDNVTYSVHGSNVEVTEVTARYEIELTDEEREALGVSPGENVAVSEIHQWTIHVGEQAVPFCPGSQNCISFQNAVALAERNRRVEAGIALAWTAAWLAYKATEISMAFALPFPGKTPTLTEEVSLAERGIVQVMSNGGRKTASAQMIAATERLSPTAPPQRYEGPWTEGDLARAAEGKGPLDLVPTKNKNGVDMPLQVHHADGMPGSGVHEVAPGAQEHLQPGVHMNKYNQGVDGKMRGEDSQLHWWMRGREMGNK